MSAWRGHLGEHSHTSPHHTPHRQSAFARSDLAESRPEAPRGQTQATSNATRDTHPEQRKEDSRRTEVSTRAGVWMLWRDWLARSRHRRRASVPTATPASQRLVKHTIRCTYVLYTCHREMTLRICFVVMRNDLEDNLEESILRLT